MVKKLISCLLLIVSAQSTLADSPSGDEVFRAINLIHRGVHGEQPHTSDLYVAGLGLAAGLGGIKLAIGAQPLRKYLGAGVSLVGQGIASYGVWRILRHDQVDGAETNLAWNYLNQIFNMSPYRQYELAMANPELAAYLVDFAEFVSSRGSEVHQVVEPASEFTKSRGPFGF